STRWGVRTVDGVDSNLALLAQLRRLKQDVRRAVAAVWLSSKDALVTKVKACPSTNQPPAAAAFPESLLGFWQRARTAPITAEEFARERARRISSNRTNLTLLADFTREDGATGWRWDGSGMKHGLVRDGELVVAGGGGAGAAAAAAAGGVGGLCGT